MTNASNGDWQVAAQESGCLLRSHGSTTPECGRCQSRTGSNRRCQPGDAFGSRYEVALRASHLAVSTLLP